MPKRNPNVKSCPHAAAWLNQHPEAKRNLQRIVRLMASCYAGDSQGFINRNAEMVEYRFAPIETEPLFWTTHIYARQKHTVVRFYLYKRFRQGSFSSKILKSATGENLNALDIPVAAADTLDKLQSFIQTTATFSGHRDSSAGRVPGAVERSKASGKASTNGKRSSIASALEEAEKQAEDLSAEPIDTEEDGRVRALRSVVMRRGQRKFRSDLLKAYGKKCAITGCSSIDVLEAAHIVPYGGDDTHRVDNGLLLRADIHTLFDLGLLWVDANTLQVEVAKKLRGSEYGALHGRGLNLPRNPQDYPLKEHLQHHAKIAQQLA